jgi:curli biogenesis system outer membrane secretion channel CsgG
VIQVRVDPPTTALRRKGGLIDYFQSLRRWGARGSAMWSAGHLERARRNPVWVALLDGGTERLQSTGSDESMKKSIFAVALAVAGLVCAGSAFAAGKPAVGVAEFKNESAAGWWRGGVGWELSGMLSNELSSSGDFRVVERAKLEKVLEEQNLAASGRVRSGTGAKMGQVTGADYLVFGTVTSYEENTASTGGGFSIKGISLGGKKSEAYIAVDVRVINSSTGEVDFSRTIEGRSSGGGVSVGLYRGGFGGNLAHEENTPAGKAIRAALVEITDYLDCVMVKRDSCESEFRAKEQKRRDGDRKSIKLD